MQRTTFFAVLGLLLALPLSHALAIEFEVKLTVLPESTVTQDEEQVSVSLNNGMVFTAQTIPENLSGVEWNWNFNSDHLDCQSAEETPEKLECQPLIPGRSVVSVLAKRDGTVRESNLIYVQVEDGDDSLPEPTEPPAVCTKEYFPVCGKAAIVCIQAPCEPIWQTYGNRCEAEATGAMEIQEGACPVGLHDLTPASYEDPVLTDFDGYQNPFSDVSLDTISGKAAAELSRRGALSINEQKTFNPDREVIRAEALKMLLLTRYTLEFLQNEVPAKAVSLPELWFRVYLDFAAKKQIIADLQNARPDDLVNTAEFLKMLSMVFGAEQNMPFSYRDVAADAWYAPYAGLAESYQLFPERLPVIRLFPAKTLTRAEVAVAIYQYLSHRGAMTDPEAKAL